MAAVSSLPASSTDQTRPKPSPTHSTTSIHSSENGKYSVPSSSNDSMSRKNSRTGHEDNLDSITTTKKPTLSTRLTRMFSSKNTTADPAHLRDFVANGDRESEIRATPNDRAASLTAPTLLTKPEMKRGRSSSLQKSVQTGDVKTTDQAKEREGPGPHRRFVMLEDGTHEHFLKTDRRQEKLSNMFKNMLMGRKKDDAGEHQLSLVSSWVDQVKNEKVANDAKGGPNCAATLVEKYGKCQEVVGRGAFGIVRISHKTDENDPKKEQLYAVKEFRRRPSESPKKYNKRLTSEFCISSALRHPNVIHTLDLLKDAKGDFCEVMEFCAGGDLYTLVLAAGKLEVVEADCYFKQLMRGVEYIHEMGVAHRDLKPENLLLTTRGSLKITDFGNGECFRMAWEQEPHMVAGLCGSAPYIAPEEYIHNEFDPRAVDVWACGVIYMAMRTGRHLWRVAQKEEDEFYQKYLEGRRDEDGYGPIETLHRARCRNVIYSILDPNPSRRITASQVLKSEWGREIKLCKAGEEGF